jgi:hypothetical protein
MTFSLKFYNLRTAKDHHASAVKYPDQEDPPSPGYGAAGTGFGLPLKGALQPSDLKVTKVQSA